MDGSDLLALHVSVDVLKRYQTSVKQSSSAAKLLDGPLLASVASALLRPVAIQAGSTPVSLEQEWFVNLSRQRKLLMHLLDRAYKLESDEEELRHRGGVPTGEFKKNNLTVGLLSLLQGEWTTISENGLRDILSLMLCTAVNESIEVRNECINFCCAALQSSDERLAFQAAETALVVAQRVSSVDALRLVPFLLTTGSTIPASFVQRLQEMKKQRQAQEEQRATEFSRESYEECILKDSPVAYFTLSGLSDLGNRANSTTGDSTRLHQMASEGPESEGPTTPIKGQSPRDKIRLSVIGDIPFQNVAAREGRSSGFFSPSCFVAMSYEEELNPPAVKSFSIECWASLSISCDGGILVSSFTNEEDAPRGYRLECRVGRDDVPEWTFRYGRFSCSGRSARFPSSPRGLSGTSSVQLPHEQDRDKKADSPRSGNDGSRVTAWTHVVGVYDAAIPSLSIYLNGKLAGSVKLSERPARNRDAPLYCGGGTVEERPHFYGHIHDLAFYDVPLSPQIVARHSSNMIHQGKAVDRSLQDTDDEDDDEDDQLDLSSVDRTDAKYLVALRTAQLFADIKSSRVEPTEAALETLSQLLEILTIVLFPPRATNRVSGTAEYYCKKLMIIALKVMSAEGITLTEGIQSRLIRLTQCDDYDISDESALVLAVCRAMKGSEGRSLTALAVLLQKRILSGRMPLESTLQTLFAAQNRAMATVDSRLPWIDKYVESLMDCARLSVKAGSSLARTGDDNREELSPLLRLAHAALCANLAHGCILSNVAATSCKELLQLIHRNSLPSRRVVNEVGGLTDLEWTLIESLCAYAFDPFPQQMNETYAAAKHILSVHDWVFKSTGKLTDATPEEEAKAEEQLWSTSLAKLAIPTVFAIRYRGKPFEQEFLKGLRTVFFALLARVLHERDLLAIAQRPGVALRCFRSSWGVIALLISTYQQQVKDEEGVDFYKTLVDRLESVCGMLRQNLPVWYEESLFDTRSSVTFASSERNEEESEEHRVDDLEEELRRRGMEFITELIARPDTSRVMESIEEQLQNQSKRTEKACKGLDLLASVLEQADQLPLNPSCIDHILVRFKSFDIHELEERVSVNELRQPLSHCLDTAMRTKSSPRLRMELAREFLRFAPKTAFDLSHSELFLSSSLGSTNEEKQTVEIRYANDALDSLTIELGRDLALPVPQFVPARTFPKQPRHPFLLVSDESQSPAMFRGTHGLLQGKFYFEFASEVKNDSILLQMGLCASKRSLEFSCGCTTTIGNGFGLGVLVDLDAGGMFSVFSIPEDDVLTASDSSQRPIRLRSLKFETAVPPRRPLFPLICVLSQQKRIRVSFAHNAAQQVVVETSQVTHIGDSKTGESMVATEESEGIEEEEETAGSTLAKPTSPIVGIQEHSRLESRFAGPLAEKYDSCATELFACGQNAFGELGVADGDLKNRKRLTESTATRGLIPCRIAAGNEFSAMVTSEGLVYTWGMNTKGSCGQGLFPSSSSGSGSKQQPPSVIPVPTLVRTLQRKTVLRVCAQNGCENMFAITSQGEAFAWGLNKYGQCGLGTMDDIIFTPTSLMAVGSLSYNDRVANVANGYSHTLILLESGKVYSCGLNSKGQLGVGTFGDIRPHPHIVDFPPSAPPDQIITCIAVGALHSALVDSAGCVWTFGKNDFGQLGLNRSIAHSDSPRRVALAAKADKVACGYHFTLVSTEDSRLFAFGKNDTGQLGIGHTRESFEPQQVWTPLEGRIGCLSCGTGHWIAVMTDGKAFACGRNKAGAVGDGTCLDRLVPSVMDFPGSGSVIQVAAGFHHTLVLCAQVDVSLFSQTESERLSELNCHSSLSHDKAMWISAWSFLTSLTSSSSSEQLSSPAALACAEWMKETLHRLSNGGNEAIIGSREEMFWSMVVHSATSLPFIGLADDTCVDLALRVATRHSDDQLNESIPSLALEWLLKILLERRARVTKEQLRQLLLLAGRRASQTQLAVASEAIHLLRSLLKERLLDESLLVNEFLCLGEDVVLDESTMLTVMGVISVLGGELETVRARGKARLVAGELDRGHAGTVVWYSPKSRVMAQIALEDGETMFARKMSDLIPEFKSPPVRLESSEIAWTALDLLTTLAKRALVLMDGNDRFSEHDNSMKDLGIAACKAIGAMFKTNPELVPPFVSKGHLSLISSQLNTSNSSIGQPVQWMERQYVKVLTGKEDQSGRVEEEKKKEHYWKLFQVADDGIGEPDMNEDVKTTTTLLDVIHFDAQSLKKRCLSTGSSVFVDPVDLETREGTSFTSLSSRDERTTTIPFREQGVECLLYPSVTGDVAADSDEGSEGMLLGTPNGEEWSLIVDIALLMSSSGQLVGRTEQHVDEEFIPLTSTGWAVTMEGRLVMMSSTASLSDSRPSTPNHEASLSRTPSTLSFISNGGGGGSGSGKSHNGEGASLPMRFDSFNRVVFVETERFSKVFVNGQRVTYKMKSSVASSNTTPPVRLLPSPSASSPVSCLVSSAQLRNYAMSDNEIRLLGRPSARGVPLPTQFDLANQLQDELELPFAWCLKVLTACQGNRREAKKRLARAESKLVRRARVKARVLSGLGFDSASCIRAVASTTSIIEAVGFLLEHQQHPNKSASFLADRSTARALSKISFAPGSVFQSKAAAGMQSLRFTDRFVRAKEGGLGVFSDRGGDSHMFELKDSSKPASAVSDSMLGLSSTATANAPVFTSSSTAAAAAGTQSSAAALSQMIHSLMKEKGSSSNLVRKELFSSYARKATVLVLDTDARNALLGPTKHFFVRDYLRAFPLSRSHSSASSSSSYARSIPSQPLDPAMEPEDDAVRILRRKLMNVVRKEAKESSWRMRQAELSIQPSRDDWIRTSPTVAGSSVSKGTPVWILKGDRVLTGKLTGGELEREISPSMMLPIELLSDHSIVSILASELRITPPPRIVPEQYLQSERKRAKEEADVNAWKNSVCRSLLEILLSELAQLACISSHRVLENGLQIAPAHAFSLVAKSGQGDLFAWRPFCAVEGFYSLGDVMEPSSSAPSRLVYMVSDEDGIGGRCLAPGSQLPLLASPIGFELVYKLVDESGESNSSVFLFRPVPPSGDYASLGLVVSSDSKPPDATSVRCVHVSCLAPARLGAGVWSREDTAQVWNVENQGSTFLAKVSSSVAMSSSPSLAMNNEGNEEMGTAGGALDDTSMIVTWSKPGVSGSGAGEDDEDDMAGIVAKEGDDERVQDEQREKELFVREIQSKTQRTILPLQLNAANFSVNTSADSAFWLLFLLVDIASSGGGGDEADEEEDQSVKMEDGSGQKRWFPWRERLFGAPLIHALLKLANESSSQSVRALRALATIVAKGITFDRFPVDLIQEFQALRRKSELLLAQECAESRDPEFALYSSRVCALVELLVTLEDASIDTSDSGKVVRKKTSSSRNGGMTSEKADDELLNSVRELDAIMDVLLDPAHHPAFPDEFLMAEDTFLKLARADDTAIIESLHPYSSEDTAISGKLLVEDASSLIVRFDRRSATSFGDCLCLEMMDEEEENLVTEMLQGNFGGSIVHVPSNKLRFRFPVEQTMNWTLNAGHKGSNIRVNNGQMTACMRKDKTWETIIATKGFARGINSWEVRVDHVTSSSNIFFGVAAKNCNVDSYVGCDEIGWGWIGCLACWHNGRKIKHPFGERLKSGDVVRVTLDLHRRCFSIALNGVDQGVALDRLASPLSLEGGKFYPAFSFYNKYDQITLLRGGVAS